MSDSSVVIVGGGLAAVRTAQELRRCGHTGSIQILSAEGEPPYDRPPLSKKYLRGDLADDKLGLWAPDRYRNESVDLRLNCTVVSLDPSARQLGLADGATVDYDRLVIATGAHARRLAVLPETDRVSTLRTAADARRLAPVIRAGGRVAVIGGGFIGLEVASTARDLGCDVTLIEAAKAPLVGAIGLEAAEWLRQAHETRGVEFRCGTSVASASSNGDGSVSLQLADGTVVTADAVVVGVGVARRCEWLADAGLEVDAGLLCDEQGRTNLPDIFGAGDIVRPRGRECIGHWTSAGDSARRAAHGVLGLSRPVPADDGYFWSDQYDMRIQFAGRVHEGTELTVVDGSMESGSFLAHCGNDGEVTGLLGVNSMRGFVMAQHKLADTLTRAVGAS